MGQIIPGWQSLRFMGKVELLLKGKYILPFLPIWSAVVEGKLKIKTLFRVLVTL